MIKLGVIGYGWQGFWDARQMVRVEGIEPGAAYDIDPERIKAAEEKGFKGYHSLDAFLADKDINLVIVATPNNFHKDLCVAAMDAGKNVMCEKPVAMNEAEVDEMIAAAKRNNVLFTVHQNRRWDQDFRVAKMVFDQGLVGKVYNIESRLHGTGGICHGWRGVKASGGGMLYDWGVHLIDQMLLLVPDKIKQIYCKQASIKNPDVDDYFKLIIEYAGGLICLVEVGTYCVRGFPRWYLNGDEGALTVRELGGAVGDITRTVKLQEKFEAPIIETAAGPTRTFAPQPPDTLVDSQTPEVRSDLGEYYRNIRDVLEGKAEPIVTHAQIKRVMRVIDTAFESARLGKSLDFTEPE